MAETAVNFVLGKLADAAVKEVLLLCGVDEQVEKVKRELIRIQAFLKDVDSRQIADERQRNWVREVRDVAYWIEDVIDSAFLLEIGTGIAQQKTEIPQSSRFTRKVNTVKKLFTKPKKLPGLHKLGEEINQILARIREINESRITYGINNLGEGSGGPGLRLPIRPPVLPDIDDPEVVGFDADTSNIVKHLLDENTTRRSVVSIVGTGGLGKTTLAQKAYNRIDIKRHFYTRIWVTVTQEYKLIELLRKIVKQFRPIDPNEHGEGEEYLLTKLYESCMGKKYLIVLDDVWTSDLWAQVGRAFPDENNGSRVLVTTRSLDVAKEADPVSEPYKLKFLTEKSSLELLLRKALPNHDPSQGYPNDLCDLAKRFVKKCGGLPLALLVLGGLLSKRSGYVAWSKMMQTMNWGVDGRACTEVLATSYKDLPLALKPCFLYFALFPEDYKIDAKVLIRMWVAEGILPEEKNRTLEDTAESFLEELVQRSMIHVSSRSYDGSIECCQIHDLLRDLAVQKAKEDHFLSVFSNGDDLKSSCRARRLAIHDSDCCGLMKYTSPNLRSLVCFSRTPNCSKHRLLKVLRTDDIELKWLEELTQLRYCELHISLNLDENEYFEKLICSMKFLQTLDLRGTKHNDLPDCIWLVKTLRHVMLSVSMSTSGPPSWADLRYLQTLTGIKSRKSWVAGLPNLPNLRELSFRIDEKLSWDVVATLLGTLKHLIALVLMSDDVPLKVADMRGFPFYPNLQSLYLSRDPLKPFAGSEISLDMGMFPVHLTELTFEGLQLQQDPMPVLEKLQNLKWLKIRWGEYHKQKMKCSAGGFVQLEQLTLHNLGNLEELGIEEGSMPMLKLLRLSGCPQLHVPLGLRHLTSLHMLYWNLFSDNLASTKANEIRYLCKHVPSLAIWCPPEM